MKTIISLMSVLILTAGCASPSELAEPSNETANELKTEAHALADHAAETAVLNHGTNSYLNNPQAPATDSLIKTEQSFTDEDGTVTLKAMADYSGTHLIGPVKLTLSDIKILNYSPSPDLIDYFHGFTHSENNFNYIKLRVSVRNTSDQTLDFAPVSILETNEGEKKDFEDDFYLQHLYGELQPGEEKTGELAFILEETEPEQLKSINIYTSEVFDDQKSVLHPGETIEIHF